MRFIDISRAHFYGKAQRELYVDLPDEEKKLHPGKCGRILKSWYGTQDASHVWQGDYVEVLLNAGFTRGRSNGAVFRHEAQDIVCLVHGDDFAIETES